MLIKIVSIGLLTVHPKFYADYKYTDQGQKVFANFEYAVSSDRIDLRCRFSKLYLL